MRHSYSWKKHYTWVKAKRKRQVAIDIFPFYNDCPECHGLHQYSKNTFHCVWTYKPKTKQNGRYNYSIKDKRRVQTMFELQKEYEMNLINLESQDKGEIPQGCLLLESASRVLQY